MTSRFIQLSLLRRLAPALALGALVSLTIGTPATAQTVLASNLGNTFGGTFQPQDTADWLGQKFSTSADLYEVTSITVSASIASGISAAVHIFTDNGGVPGTDTGVTFSGPSPSPTFGTEFVTFTETNNMPLSGSTFYWLVIEPIGVSSGHALFLDNTNTSTGGTGLGFVQEDTAGSFNSGTDWTAGFYTGKSLQFSLEAIPEPSTYAVILGVVAIGGALYRRRRAAPASA